MVIIELVSGLLIVVVIMLVMLTMASGSRRLIAWRHGRTVEGRIERKRKEIDEHSRYLGALTREIATSSVSEYRREMLRNYLELAQKKMEQLELEYQVLEVERDRKEFEERMRRNA
jgi:hypothetical protein